MGLDMESSIWSIISRECMTCMYFSTSACVGGASAGFCWARPASISAQQIVVQIRKFLMMVPRTGRVADQSLLHLYDQRQLVTAVQQGLARMIRAYRKVEHSRRRNRQPVEMLVRAGRTACKYQQSRRHYISAKFSPSQRVQPSSGQIASLTSSSDIPFWIAFSMAFITTACKITRWSLMKHSTSSKMVSFSCAITALSVA